MVSIIMSACMHMHLQDSVMYGGECPAPRPGRLLSGGSVDGLGQNGSLGDDHYVATTAKISG